MTNPLPRILVIDDLFGRQLKDRSNRDRSNLCGMYGLRDVTGDEIVPPDEEVVEPIAEAVFFRGQRPLCAGVGDTVENDLESTMTFVRRGWELKKHNNKRWSLVLLDLCFYTGLVNQQGDKKLPGMPEGQPDDGKANRYFGLKILERLNTEFPELPVIILSSMTRDEVSRTFTANGARGFLPKSDTDSPKKLREFIFRYGLIPDHTGMIVGRSLKLMLALRLARQYAGYEQNILIRGERGTGKDLMAEYIHRTGAEIEKNSERPYVTVNSAVFTSGLFASELFGIGKRKATGVDKNIGLIKAADGGTLFLDEIAEMPPEVQAAMLRVLQDRKIIPVGEQQTIDINVRFLSATNVDVEGENSSFRSDLLDRLRLGGTIWLPPLRERKEDIPLLVEQFVREAESIYVGALEREIDTEAMVMLRGYHWPGNIRELRSVVFEAVQHFPDVEYLVPQHLSIEGKGMLSCYSKEDGEFNDLPESPVGDSGKPASLSLADLLELISNVTFDVNDRKAWAGQLLKLQSSYAGLVAEYLKTGLLATRKSTPENTEGKIFYLPAMRLLTGNPELSAIQAAAMIKRLLKISPDDQKALLEDHVLRVAHDNANRARPSSTRKKS